MSKEIGEEIMDTYFELKKERAKKDKENTETSTDLTDGNRLRAKCAAELLPCAESRVSGGGGRRRSCVLEALSRWCWFRLALAFTPSDVAPSAVAFAKVPIAVGAQSVCIRSWPRTVSLSASRT